jgi:16S rRNA G1207 methylase RsmC
LYPRPFEHEQALLNSEQQDAKKMKQKSLKKILAILEKHKQTVEFQLKSTRWALKSDFCVVISGLSMKTVSPSWDEAAGSARTEIFAG